MIIFHNKNSIGFRGKEPPGNFENYLTIVSVGGSTAECALLSDDKTWTYVLGSKLDTVFDRVWINNAGLDGHSTFGHIVLMEDYILKLRPKIVLFLVGQNDVGRRNYSDYDVEHIRRGISFQSAKSFLKSAAAHSEAFAFGLNIYRYLRALTFGLPHQQIDLKERKALNLPDAAISDVKRLHNERFLQGYESRLTKLIRICKEFGIKPVLITQPGLVGEGTDKVTNVNLDNIKIDHNVNGRLMWEVLELYNDVTRKTGRSEGVLVIDLAKEMPKNSEFYYDYAHFTNDGAEKVAQIVCRYLVPYLMTEERGFLKKGENNRSP